MVEGLGYRVQGLSFKVWGQGASEKQAPNGDTGGITLAYKG